LGDLPQLIVQISVIHHYQTFGTDASLALMFTLTVLFFSFIKRFFNRLYVRRETAFSLSGSKQPTEAPLERGNSMELEDPSQRSTDMSVVGHHASMSIPASPSVISPTSPHADGLARFTIDQSPQQLDRAVGTYLEEQRKVTGDSETPKIVNTSS